jgi:hypothetical protein
MNRLINIYARFVLWLISPALDEPQRRRNETAKAVLNVVLKNIARIRDVDHANPT